MTAQEWRAELRAGTRAGLVRDCGRPFPSQEEWYVTATFVLGGAAIPCHKASEADRPGAHEAGLVQLVELIGEGIDACREAPDLGDHAVVEDLEMLGAADSGLVVATGRN